MTNKSEAKPEHCQMCETGEHPIHGKVYPRKYVDIRGDKAWRHPHYRDQMFFTNCEIQTEASESTNKSEAKPEPSEYPLTPTGDSILNRFRVAIHSVKPLTGGAVGDPIEWMKKVTCGVLKEILQTPDPLRQESETEASESGGQPDLIREVIDILCYRRVCLAEFRLVEERQKLAEEVARQVAKPVESGGRPLDTVNEWVKKYCADESHYCQGVLDLAEMVRSYAGGRGRKDADDESAERHRPPKPNNDGSSPSAHSNIYACRHGQFDKPCELCTGKGFNAGIESGGQPDLEKLADKWIQKWLLGDFSPRQCVEAAIAEARQVAKHSPQRSEVIPQCSWCGQDSPWDHLCQNCKARMPKPADITAYPARLADAEARLRKIAAPPAETTPYPRGCDPARSLTVEHAPLPQIDERAEFEKWLGEETCEVHYDNSANKNAWYGWQARAELREHAPRQPEGSNEKV